MKTTHIFLALMVGLFLLVVGGCTPRYVITQDLTAPIPDNDGVRIGAIEDLLPADLAVDKRPSAEDIKKFEKYLREEIEHRGHLGLQVNENGGARYEIRGRLLDYKKGSGLLRFLFGFGAGAAKVLTELKLVDLVEDQVIFAGNFEGQIVDWADTGDKMFKNVARDFTRELEKQTGKMPEPVNDPLR